MLQPEIRLRQSIIDGNLLVVKRLLKRFPDLLENIDPSNGWSSLHYAAFNGRYLVCVHLISLGHDKNEALKTFKQNSSVHLALKNGHEQTTHLLLQHFPKLLDSKGEDGLTPLHISIIGDYYKCVEMLLTIGADIQKIDDEGNNSLHLAMKYGSLQNIKILINHGIDLELKNKNGLKPIDVASSFQVEKFYHQVVNSKENDDVSASPMIEESSSSSFNQQPLSTPVLGRTHSNSLPPLPSVTTARRPSNASSIARSPVPRSTVSLGFMGSNSNSYTFSPTSTSFSPLILSKPPNGSSSSSNFTYNPPSSPVLISPISGPNSNSTIKNTTILEEGQPSSLVNSTSLSSFPSMSSLSSGKNTPPASESRTRSSSTNQNNNTGLTGLPSLLKSRSNSSTRGKAINPGKISPPNSGQNQLSRISTTSSSNTQVSSTGWNDLEKKESGGSSGLSNFFDNDVRKKLNNKFESVTSELKRGSGGNTSGSNSGGGGVVSRKSSGSILNIPIASLRRKE